MKLYNTLTRTKEDFAPLDGSNKVRMYSCGPTVYNYAHIGNLRTYVFMDLLRRCLKYEGYKIKGVMNITDVGHLLSDADDGEDKMQKAAREQNKDPYEIAAFYTSVFFEDLKKLNIEKPELTPRATDHIADMIKYVEGLVEKGVAYETADGVYFDISKFPEYGKLSGIKLEDQLSGARVEVNDGKRHPADFALWKKAPKEHIMQWDSPWGKSYPGWHIECSAMSRKYLGDVFDIHTGGVDHIPIHHENDDVRLFHRDFRLSADFRLEGGFFDFNAARIDKTEFLGQPFGRPIKTVTGDTRGILNNGKTRPNHAVEDRTFPNVRRPDKGDKTKRHYLASNPVFSLTMARIASTTSSIESGEVSSWTESSAGVSGAKARWESI